MKLIEGRIEVIVMSYRVLSAPVVGGVKHAPLCLFGGAFIYDDVSFCNLSFDRSSHFY